MAHSWTVTNADAGERLDVFVTSRLGGRTRSQVAKLIKGGAATVNEQTASVHHFLKTGDEVRIEEQVTSERDAVQAPTPTILSETSEYLIVNKPAGLLVHPDAKQKRGTLVEFLTTRDPSLQNVGDPLRHGIVHRLDRDTSGLLVVAKTPRAYDELKQQFADRFVEKKYIALVYGDIESERGDITFSIARSRTKARMAARPQQEEGRRAVTHYRVLKRLRGATLLELTPLTGRTHQIRAHLFALNHPIIGDPLYAPRTLSRSLREKVRDARLMLHATHLGFQDPLTGARINYDLPPDESFERICRQFSS